MGNIVERGEEAPTTKNSYSDPIRGQNSAIRRKSPLGRRPVPLDVGSVDVAVNPFKPQSLGPSPRNLSAPQALLSSRRSYTRSATSSLPAPNMGVGSRRKHEASFAQSDFVMRRYSFLRERSRIGSSSLPSNLLDESRVNAIGRKTIRIVLDADEITAIAESSHAELLEHGYNLQQWEQIYRQMTRMYDKLEDEDDTSLSTGTSATEIKVPKWTLERALDKVSKCIESNPEFKQRQVKKWFVWEQENEEANKIALIQMKAFVPPDIKKVSAKDLVEKHSYSWPLAKRLVEKKIFHLLHMDLDEISKIYNSDFGVKGRFDYTGLDIVELRAIYLKTEGIETKWRKKMRELLYELSTKEKNGTLGKFCKRHHAYSYKKGKINNAAVSEEVERITLILRAKAKYLFSELEGKNDSKKKELLTRVERITGSKENKYTKMVRRRLSLSLSSAGDADEGSEITEDEEKDIAESFENFYTTGTFAPSQKSKVKVKDKDSDLDEMDTIEQLVWELSAQVSSPAELEKLLATVFE